MLGNDSFGTMCFPQRSMYDTRPAVPSIKRLLTADRITWTDIARGMGALPSRCQLSRRLHPHAAPVRCQTDILNSLTTGPPADRSGMLRPSDPSAVHDSSDFQNSPAL